MVRSFYVKIIDVFHFQTDDFTTCFIQKKVSISLEKANVSKQAVLAEETVN